MAKQLLFDDAAKRKILTGVEKLNRTVRVTLGPSGRNVVLKKSFGGPVITKDGVSVSKEIELEDPFENMGAKLVNEVANKTNDVAGDGTTTAIVLSEALFSNGLRYITSGVNPMDLKRGIDAAVDAVVEDLRKQARPIRANSEIAQVGSISANNDRAIGELLAQAMEKVGKDGVITVEESKTAETWLESVDGLQFDKGYLSPYFITNPTDMTCQLENAAVMVYEKKIGNLRTILPVLEHCAQNGRPLLIIAEDVENEALATLVVNRLRGKMNVCAVKAPGFGDRRKQYLGDIAVLTGGELVSEETGMKVDDVQPAVLGTVSKVVVDKDNTTLVGGGGKKKAVENRVAQIRTQIESATSDYDKEKLQERLARLSGGVAVIHVGGTSETVMKERKDRIEDALHATRAAVEEGIVPGGGVALVRSIAAVEALRLAGDQKFGGELVRKAIASPLRQIADNAGLDGNVLLEETLEQKGGKGLDVSTGEWVDMFKAGIVDPVKVVRTALQNAASVVGLMLTTEAVVTELKEKAKEVEGALS